jgi:spermidine synthase
MAPNNMKSGIKYNNQPLLLAFFSMLFLISGAAGLIYEIIWERLLAIYFGVTMTSITLIVSAYMAGLGLGSLFGGRITQRIKSSLLIYGALEIAIGLFGLISPFLLGWIGRLTAGSPYWLVFIISFAFLLLPTFLMGMTLPLLTHTFINRVNISGRVVGLLYGINTLGAAFGSLLSAYILINKFGFTGAIWVAVALNISVGLLAILCTRLIKLDASRQSSPIREEKESSRWKFQQILFTSFMIGFIGLGFEMLWIRILHIINKNTSYGFPSILFVFLIGLALGGYYWGRRADRSSDPEKLFWRVEISAGITATLAFLLFWMSLNSNVLFPGLDDFWSMQKPATPFVDTGNLFVFSRREALYNLFNYSLPILIMVFPASFLLGGGLPILDRIAINSPDVAGRRIGDIHLANIVGSVFGSLLMSFWMLPILGTEWSHKILILLGMTFPILYFLLAKNRIIPDLQSRVTIGVSLSLLLFIPGKGQFYNRLFEVATNANATIHESSDSVLALTNNSQANQMLLWIGGETNSFYPSDGTYESRGILCAGASKPTRMLIIGMGGGVAARFFQTIPGIEEIVIVELMGELGNFLHENVPLVRPVFEDSRIQYIVDDGRRYLYANPNEKFDLIFIDPLRWYSSGHNNLYSMEAMQLYQTHLTENGVFCAYIDQNHALPFTIAQAFSEVDQFSLRTIIASNQAIHYDFAYMESITENYLTRMENSLKPGTQDTLQPMSLLSKFTRNRDRILIDEEKSPILLDLKPALEYYFFTPPIKKPIWLKDDIQVVLIPRIKNCNSCK